MNISAKTAMTRNKPSVPVQIVTRRHMLPSNARILDFGCGKGFDCMWLTQEGYGLTFGYDPNYTPTVTLDFVREDIRPTFVFCTYVLNVIEDIDERKKVVSDIYDILQPGGRAMFSTRSWDDVDKSANKGRWTMASDGYRTNSGTFQRGYDENGLDGIVLLNAKWINTQILNSDPPMVMAWKGYNN